MKTIQKSPEKLHIPDLVSIPSLGILSTIGNTPLIELTKAMQGIEFRLFAKLESFNPGGSAKDRAAFYIIKNAIENGYIRTGTTIIESSSGNMGIALAQICAYFDLRFICVVDPKTTSQNIRILETYGAKVDIVTEPDPITKEFLKARMDRVQFLMDFIKDTFWPNQYANSFNPLAHYQTTMHEIAMALNRKVDFLFCAVSTGGTIRGCAEYIRDHELKTKIIAVDAIGSVIFGGAKGKRLLPGHGAAIEPVLCQNGLIELIEECVRVSDLECVIGCRTLVQQEGLLTGGSSGGVLMALEKSRDSIPKDSTCVTIFPDHGERYLDTIYSDQWVKEQFGDVAHLWQKH